MKIYLFSIITIFAAGFVGCKGFDDDNEAMTKWDVSYGMVSHVENAELKGIIRDDGAFMLVTSNTVSSYKFEVGDRLVLNYTILDGLPANDSRYGWQIRLNAVQQILSKPPVRQSFILAGEQHRQDSVGSDPIDVEHAWFGGKYLNIDFGLMRLDNTTMHMLNLVHDDTNPDTQNCYVAFRHNAYGDLPSSMKYGLVSFDLTSLIPINKTKINVILEWTDYNGTEHRDEGVFEPYVTQNSTSGVIKMHEYTPVK